MLTENQEGVKFMTAMPSDIYRKLVFGKATWQGAVFSLSERHVADYGGGNATNTLGCCTCLQKNMSGALS